MDKYGSSYPQIIDYIYYGEYKKNPNLLAVIFIFEKDSDLILAEGNGLTETIRTETMNELISNGYPEKAFDKNIVDYNITDKFSEMNNFEESIKLSLENPFVSINFISNECVQNETDGDLFQYLK